MRKILIIGMLFLIGIVSCYFPNKKESKPFRIAVSNLPETLDPLMRSEVFTNIAMLNIFENLFYWENGYLKPRLAIEWYYKNKEKTVLEIKLRKNVFFHNMTPMTTKDIISSIKRAFTNNRSTLYFSSIDSLTAIDDYTLIIYLSKYRKSILSELANVPIYNSALINQLDDEQIANNPIGTGHFMYDSSDSTALVLKAFPNYWGRKTNLRKVILNKITSKKEQLNLFLENKVDLLISPEIKYIKKVIFSDKVDLVSIQSKNIVYMMLNGRKYLKGNIKNPLNNFLVRKAISKSLDLDSFIAQKLQRKAKRINFPLLPSLLGNDPKYPLTEFSPAEAIQLLKDAGYPNGFKMDILCVKNKYMGDSLSGVFVQSSLKKIGIDANIKFFNSKEFYRRIDKKEGMAYITGYSYAGDDIVSVEKTLYSSIPKQSHLNRYKNQIKGFNYKVKMLTYLREKSDKWFEFVAQCLEMSYKSNYIIPMYYPDGLLGLNSKYEFYSREPYIFDFDNFREKK